MPPPLMPFANFSRTAGVDISLILAPQDFGSNSAGLQVKTRRKKATKDQGTDTPFREGRREATMVLRFLWKK